MEKDNWTHFYLHSLKTDVPGLDDLALSDPELEGLGSLLASVELLVVCLQLANVVDADHLAGLNIGAVSDLQVLEDEAPFQGLLRGLSWKKIKRYIKYCEEP